MKYLLFFFVIVSNLACNSGMFGNGFYTGNYSKEINPPGTIKISDNLFVDENEVSNIDYKEFMYWTKRVYGEDSDHYKEIVPDTNVWNEQNFIPSLNEIYLSHPAYDNFPLVGVNLNQANLYTNWRNDRIAELMLYTLGAISLDPFCTPDNHFTIKRYLNRQYQKTIKYNDILVPIYRIPNKNEWDIFSKGKSNFKFGTDSLSRKNKKIIKKWGHLYCTKEYVESNGNKSLENKYSYLTTPSFMLSKNEFNLHGIVGNVSEIVSDMGISKGGSWINSIEEIELKSDNLFHKANCWTGFRNICEWKKLEIKNGT